MAEYRCEKAVDHAGVCTVDPDACGHWCCRVAYWQTGAGLRVSSQATPHVRERDKHHAPRTSDPAWEKGLVGEHRCDGSFMPLLDKDGYAMTNGQAQHLGGSSYVERRLRETKSPEANAVTGTVTVSTQGA